MAEVTGSIPVAPTTRPANLCDRTIVMHAYRTHTCNALRVKDAGITARLSGWIHSTRDHGGLLFVDLRDHYGITQVVLSAGSKVFDAAKSLRVESVVTVTGIVVCRNQSSVNPRLPTGEIELLADSIEVQSMAAVLPFTIAGDANIPEEIRLCYRYLDLRRESVHNSMMLRAKVIAYLRQEMTAAGFTEFQTPILTASSPEGARDFLVPSRLHPGQFYALPQAPQQFKQLAMVAGFDRYFQIAPCFRDEAARADRSPGEFYQLDFEMSFVTQDDVFDTIEPVIGGVFRQFGGQCKVTEGAFPRIPYDRALIEYGSDKPDLRNPLKIVDVTQEFSGSSFGLFSRMVADGSVVRAIPAPGAGLRPRVFFDKLNEWAREQGVPGLGFIVFEEGVAKGPIARHLEPERIEAIRVACRLQPGDAVFFAAGPKDKTATFSGAARLRIGSDLDLCEKDAFRLCWITDFPMYEVVEDTGKIDFSHNPFSMPQGGLEALNSQDPLTIKAFQYDIVCNGVELSSGAIRNHRPDIMLRAFEIAGYEAAEVEARFGGMLNAFRFGAPPHGGSAPGIDRIVMLLANEPNIREVILFPLNQQGRDLMMGAPSVVPESRLNELSLRLNLPALR